MKIQKAVFIDTSGTTNSNSVTLHREKLSTKVQFSYNRDDLFWFIWTWRIPEILQAAIMRRLT